MEADFDHDPGRFAANQLATQNFSMIGDVHDQVADRLAKITIGPILDLGGGNGTLARLLPRHGRSCPAGGFLDHPLTVTKRGRLIWARRP